jgi:CRP/FNR family transcriptional regulator
MAIVIECHAAYCYRGNNIGMTPSASISLPSVGHELLVSRSMSRQLAQALAAPLALGSRALHRFEVGATLCKSGDHITQLPFVISGRLDAIVHVPGTQGGQIVPIAFGAGEVAFLSYLFNQLPSGVDLVAGELTAIKWVPVAEIESALLKDPALLIRLVRFLGQRLREVQARERAWASRGVQHRLCAGLVRLLVDLPRRKDGRLIVELTHEQLAARCGISRPKASIALKHLERSGLVVLGHRSIEVLDPIALTKLTS